MALLLPLLVAGCANAPVFAPAPPPASSGPARAMDPAPRAAVPASPMPGADGPPTEPGPDPLSVPDAEPKVEPIRPGGPNKPYEAAGQVHVPVAKDAPMVETGVASWYGKKFHGRRTANGEVYDMHAMTAAHKTMPLPSFARVRNPANGREVVVRVNDRGPFVAGRIIDLSYAAAIKLGIVGLGRVEVSRLTHEEIRAMGQGGSTLAAAVTRPAGNTGQASRVSSAPNVAAPVETSPLRPDHRVAPASVEAAPVVLARATSAQPALPSLSAPPVPLLATAAPAQTLSMAAPTEGGVQVAPVAVAEPVSVVALAPVAAPTAAAQAVAAPAPAPASVAALPPVLVADAVGSAAPPSAGALAGPPGGAAPGPLRAYAQAAAGFWLQLGAFGRSEGAMGFHQQLARELEWLAPNLAVFVDGALHRLQAGPFASREQAQSAAERVRSTVRLAPLVIERR